VLSDLAGICCLKIELCLSKSPDDVTEGRHVNKHNAPSDLSGIAKSRDCNTGPPTLKVSLRNTMINFEPQQFRRQSQNLDATRQFESYDLRLRQNANMATELTVQSERAFQKQPHIFLNNKSKTKSSRVGKGGRRWYKDVGLGFRTPKTAIEGTYIGMLIL
jgi:Ribosomal_S17 N-terminal